MAQSRWTRAWTRGAALSVATVAVWAVSPAAVQAHTDLLESWPAAGEVADDPVDRVRLEFATPVVEELTQVVVTGGPRTSAAEPRVSGGLVEAPVAGLDSAGTYEVAYRTVAVDGHPVTGSFTFDLGPGAVAAAVAGADSVRRDADGSRGTSWAAVAALAATLLGAVGLGAARRRPAVARES
jgi:methionine-rich copper-binding protein CopC